MLETHLLQLSKIHTHLDTFKSERYPGTTARTRARTGALDLHAHAGGGGGGHAPAAIVEV